MLFSVHGETNPNIPSSQWLNYGAARAVRRKTHIRHKGGLEAIGEVPDLIVRECNEVGMYWLPCSVLCDTTPLRSSIAGRKVSCTYQSLSISSSG